jgi:hypothetical protein
MTPIIKHRQPVRLAPATWEECGPGDVVYARVRGHFYTHLVKAISAKGVLIGNNHGHNNGWTKKVYGIVTEVLPMDSK